jgi:type IV secretory pathway TrbD component
MQTHTLVRRRNRVYKSLHKPLTYLGVERTLFYFVCVGAVGAFNLFNSLIAGVAVFIVGFAFGHWVTNTDPAFLRILAKSERYNVRYREAFHLNDTELDLIAGLVPPGQMLIRKAQSSKKVQLNVDSVSHWMATNNARDNLKKREYFERFG